MVLLVKSDPVLCASLFILAFLGIVLLQTSLQLETVYGIGHSSTLQCSRLCTATMQPVFHHPGADMNRLESVPNLRSAEQTSGCCQCDDRQVAVLERDKVALSEGWRRVCILFSILLKGKSDYSRAMLVRQDSDLG